MAYKHNAFEGYHRFKNDAGDAYGSFRVYYFGRFDQQRCDLEDGETPPRAGWYWIAEFPGCLPDGDVACGPFTSSRLAWRDAQQEGG